MTRSGDRTPLASSDRVALVTDAGRTSSVTIIRSLGRLGWRVIAADTDPRSPGFRSKFAAETLVYPSPRTAPDEFVRTLERAARSSRIDLIVPVTDEAIHPLARERVRFEGLCHLAVPDPEALALVTNKAETLAMARRLDVPVPRTHVVRTLEEARAAAPELGWPVVVKPAVSRVYDPERGTIESFSVSYARSLEELEERVTPALRGPAVLLQEYTPGVGHGVEMLALRGEPLLAFQHRRLAEIPVQGGAAAWRESEPLDAELFESAKRLVRELRWTGLIMVEFKVGEKKLLIEINGRVWGSLPLAVHCGVDFPAALAGLYFGPPPEAPRSPSYPIGVRTYNLELMLSWIIQVLAGRKRYPYLPGPPRRDALRGVLGLLHPRQRSDLLFDRDLGPLVADLGRIARKWWGKAGRALGAPGKEQEAAVG